MCAFTSHHTGTTLNTTAFKRDVAMARPMKPRTDALMVPMRDAPNILGLSRSSLYRLEREGSIRLVKHGNTTLVEMASARAYLASLPAFRRSTPS